MRRLPAVRLSLARIFTCAAAALVCFASLLSFSQSPEAASLRGTVRDIQGKPVSAAIVTAEAKNGAQPLTTKTDARGNFSFAALPEGTYSVRVSLPGYGDAQVPAIFLGSQEARSLDLTLGPGQTGASQSGSPTAAEFFDQPKFTVSGVTDTTNLGGHGSDTVARTRDTLAKETVSLGKSATSPSADTTTEKVLREKAENAPGSFEANHQFGRLLMEEGRAREAIPYLERAAALHPADYQSSYDLAVANAHAGNYESARAMAQALLAHNDKAELHHLLGDVQEKIGNPLEAVREYQRAAELDPSEPYIFDWGSELLLHHAPEPALEVFSQGNRLFPRSVRVLIGLGAAWFARGSYAEAVQRICEASDLRPDDSAPYRFLGKIEIAESAPPDALVERLHRFATLHPDSAEANFYYAIALWKRRKHPADPAVVAQLESLLNNAVHLDPKFAAAYLQLGILHSEQRDLPKAIADYQQAIQIDPQMQEAHYRLAQAYRQKGEAERAKAELQLYEQISAQSEQKVERERREIRQFVYTLRDQSPALQ